MHSVIGRPAGLRRTLLVILVLSSICGLIVPRSHALVLTDNEIAALQNEISQRPLPDRIAFWAERFVGTPYDRDPLGEYVRREIVVADERVDCMYHVFRSVELARSLTPAQAVEMALDMRFHGKGLLESGRVLNYDVRYAYGEDMVQSGKFGKEVTGLFGQMSQMRGSRGTPVVYYASREAAFKAFGEFRAGDIIFFVRWPHKRILDEIVGHIGIVIMEKKPGGEHDLYLVHAAGMKGKSGTVRKVPLRTYLANMPFAGVQITRFE